MTAHPLLSAIDLMDDRTKLMLIDQIADSLDEGITDELADGLAVAFERAEVGFSGTFTPLYPAGSLAVNRWQVWRSERDRAINAFLGLYGKAAA